MLYFIHQSDLQRIFKSKLYKLNQYFMRKLILFVALIFIFSTSLMAKKEYKKSKNDQQNQEEFINSKNKKSKSKKKQKQKHHQHQYLRPDQPQFWINSALAAFLSSAGGFCSGMTVGLNSIDKLSLEIMSLTGTSSQKGIADRILNTIKDHHLFLVTLLVGNAIVLESLPLVVHTIMPDWAAILFSTFVVLIVAEIVPMSATTGPQKIILAYYGSPLVNLMINIFYPIAYPIARGLDKLLGCHDTSKLKRRDFLPFINQMRKNELMPQQIKLINRFFIGENYTSVKNIMIPIQQIHMVSLQEVITKDLIQKFNNDQFSFIMVYDGSSEQQQKNPNISAVIKLKQFTLKYLKMKNKNNLKIKDIVLPQLPVSPKSSKSALFQKQLKSKDDIRNYNEKNKLPVVFSDTGLLDMLHIFSLKSSRVALVHKQQRRKDDTNIAYIDSDNQIVYYDPYDGRDKSSIIGIVIFSRLLQQIIDAQNKVQVSVSNNEQKPQKRRLIKKASIISLQ